SCVYLLLSIVNKGTNITQQLNLTLFLIQETEGNLYVHSFYRNKDQLGLQDQYFRNRTSLFKDQISRGNASLQLTGVEVQDQDRYRCYTNTIRGEESSFINLKVDAPVSKVKILRVENRIICSSEGIYPEPDLTWSTRPPSNLTLQNQTSIQQTEQQLYNISSSLILSDSETDLIYIFRNEETHSVSSALILFQLVCREMEIVSFEDSGHTLQS
uniref:Butyrophilin subfamily 3 member A2-like Ig-C domain-containing protein n=1 Tax=Lates calcarifer TaxID=8187 RepID=A0A4W6G5J8_LATCA